MSGAVTFQKTSNVSRETLDMYSEWNNLLTHWNKKINLVSASTINDFWVRHALDSHQLLEYLPRVDVSVLDMGSGAGFPGLALAISLKTAEHGAPEGRVTLVESNGKKCNFLRTVIRTLELPAKVVQQRAEVFASANTEGFDVITARAFAPLPKLFEYSAPFWKDGVLGIFPKGRDWQGEIEQAKQDWDFTVETVPSQTDADAQILLVSGLKNIDK